MARLLYSGTRNASSWALRAWLALKEAGVAFDEEVVDIRRPQRFANLDRIRARWPLAVAWMDRVLARDSVREWMRQALAQPPVLLDDYRSGQA